MPPLRWCPHSGTAAPTGIMVLGAGVWHFASLQGGGGGGGSRYTKGEQSSANDGPAEPVDGSRGPTNGGWTGH